MKSFRSLTIFTVLFNFLIVIAVTHGIAFIGLLEIFWLPGFYSIGTDDFSLSFTSSYYKTISAVAFLSLVGQILLIFSLLVKGRRTILVARITGLIILWIGFFYLTHHLLVDIAARYSLVTGLPFLICTVVLFYKTIKQPTPSS